MYSDDDLCIAEQIKRMYECDERYVITTPGKFEGETIEVPFFWHIAIDGGADVDEFEPAYGDRPVYKFQLTEEDTHVWPHLADLSFPAELWVCEYDDGSVNSEIIEE